MLDEQEYAIIAKLYALGFKTREQFCRELNLPADTDLSIDQRYRLVRDKYRELTGFDETNENAIMHHRIAQYGEPCENCRKPLRTPTAKFCAACGRVKGQAIHISQLIE